MRSVTFLVLAFAPLAWPQDADIGKLIQDVSTDRIAQIEQKLESFKTRNIYSSTVDSAEGIGAAREWIASQFRSFSPRLQVSFDKHRIAKQNTRMTGNVELWNVVAILPGTSDPTHQVLLTAHYDTISFVFHKTPDGKNEIDPVLTAAAPFAPGVTDDGSGVATILEAARVLSQRSFNKTLVFIAFAGEEYGLFGSAAYAEAARAKGDPIDAVLNNDIVGSSRRGNAESGNDHVNVYSEDPADSPSRLLAKFMQEAAERYQPGFHLNLVMRYDRFHRGGDHSSFNQFGYPAVRITTPYENFSNQHTPTDTFANTDPVYASRVAKANIAAAAALADAPRAPVLGILGRGTAQDGSSGYDAVLNWTDDDPQSARLQYKIVIRQTTENAWQQQIPVGPLTTYTLKDVNIDEVVLGVVAIDANEKESLVSAWTNPPPLPKPLQTY